MTRHPAWVWAAFAGIVLTLLVLDLSVFHRSQRAIRMREALLSSLGWVSVAVVFGLGVWHFLGREAGVAYFTTYVLEKSLSVDNLFVFLLIFTYFQVDEAHQHKVLFWGILGAFVMRAIFIVAGIALISKLQWVIFFFAAFLIYTGIKMVAKRDEKVEPEKNPALRLLRRFFRVSDTYDGTNFFTRIEGALHMTPLFIVVVAIETTDVMFALDSVPLGLLITQDAFVIYSSNVFAILGLRALYFALAVLLDLFRFLEYGVALILVMVGGKIIVKEALHVDVGAMWSLAFIAGTIGFSIAASVAFPARPEGGETTPHAVAEAIAIEHPTAPDEPERIRTGRYVLEFRRKPGGDP